MRLKVGLRVAVACVTFETVKVTSPIAFMGKVDRVYLLHYTRKDEMGKENIYGSFLEEVTRQLVEIQGIDDIRPVRVKVYRFPDVLQELVKVLSREQKEGNSTYVNISAGPNEYAAAAAIASMMVEDARPFTVGTKEWQVPEEDLTIYFDGDKPVGMSKEVHDPRDLPCFHIEMPDEDVVRALRVLKIKLDKGHRTSYSSMIEALKVDGCWDRPTEVGTRGPTQAEKMYYSRHFIHEWTKHEWVKRDRRGRLELTDDGVTVTEVFYA
jgi:hypothetical protein